MQQARGLCPHHGHSAVAVVHVARYGISFNCLGAFAGHDSKRTAFVDTKKVISSEAGMNNGVVGATRVSGNGLFSCLRGFLRGYDWIAFRWQHRAVPNL